VVGFFNVHLTANLLGNLPVKKSSKSVKISQNYGQESVTPFLAHPVFGIKFASAGCGPGWSGYFCFHPAQSAHLLNGRCHSQETT